MSPAAPALPTGSEGRRARLADGLTLVGLRGALHLAPAGLGPHVALPGFAAACARELRTVVRRYATPVLLELSETPQLLDDLGEDACGQGSQRSDESPVVDRAALVDHHLALLSVAGDAAREDHPKQVLTRQPGRAGQHPPWPARP